MADSSTVKFGYCSMARLFKEVETMKLYETIAGSMITLLNSDFFLGALCAAGIYAAMQMAVWAVTGDFVRW